MLSQELGYLTVLTWFSCCAQCSEEAATVCAMVGVGGAIFYRPKDKAVRLLPSQTHSHTDRSFFDS